MKIFPFQSDTKKSAKLNCFPLSVVFSRNLFLKKLKSSSRIYANNNFFFEDSLLIGKIFRRKESV